ncbi:MAG: tetratricopeptide repeat protein [Deltaproteobacteria bacterium]|nr:tetratricopeptide repeat protein [Deltaproteobacteria bacterium]
MAAVDKKKLIESASKFIAKNQLDKAIKDLQKVLELEPKNNQVALKIAELFLKLDKKQDAVNYYELASNMFRDSGFYDKAIAVYRQVLSLSPLSADNYLKLAELFRKKNLTAEAVSNYKVAIAIYEKEGKVQDALKILKTITELEPSNLPGRMKLASLYIKNGLKSEAYKEFVHIAEKLIEAKKTIDLITVYEKMLAIKPDDVNVSKQLIKLYLGRGDYQKVLLKVKEIIVLGKPDTDSLIALAKAYTALEKTPLAISAYKEVAKLYTKEGLAPQAQDIYKKILELDPTDQQALQIVTGARPAEKPMIEIEPEPLESADLKSEESSNSPVRQPEVQPEKKGGPGPKERVGQEKREGLSAEEIDKYLSEAQVYKRYGLNAKAVEKLLQIVDASPSHKTSLTELFELYQLDKKFKEASGIAEKLYNILIADGEIEQAEDFIKRALSGDPDNEVLKALIGAGAGPAESRETTEEPAVQEAQPAPERADVAESKEEAIEQPEGAEQVPEEIDTGIEIEVETTPSADKQGPESRVTSTAEETQVHGEDSREEPRDEVPIPEQIEFTPEIGGGPAEAGRAPRSEEIEFSFSDEEMKEVGPERPAAGTQEQSAPAVHEPMEQGIDVIDSLDEAEFYYQQGILTEAKEILRKVLKAFPDEERAKKRLADITAKEEAMNPGQKEQGLAELGESFIQKEAPIVSASSDEDLFDLARELENELSASAGKAGEPQTQTEEDQQVSVEEVLEAFKKGVEKSVDKQDAETHYNLGIAYKEMGLIDEAINEFNIAIISPDKKADGLIMLGMSYMGKGLPGKAIEMYRQALSSKGGIQQENIGLLYEFALALEAYGDMKSAYTYFQEVAKIDGSFRDIKGKIDRLAEFANDESSVQSEAQKPAVKEKFTLEDILDEDQSQVREEKPPDKQVQAPAPLPRPASGTDEKPYAHEMDSDKGKTKQPKKKVSYI